MPSVAEILIPLALDTPYSYVVPGERAHFVQGAIVNLTATPGADGQLTARRIQVSKPKPERA